MDKDCKGETLSEALDAFEGMELTIEVKTPGLEQRYIFASSEKLYDIAYGNVKGILSDALLNITRRKMR